MILVIASRADAAALVLVQQWASEGASLLTPRDLSQRGWRYYLNGSQPSTAGIGGQKVRVDQIQGVLTRIPSIWPQELSHIIPADRSYVAAEMTAFLTSWLAALPCAVLNRPTSTGLSGPYWRHEQWTQIATEVGLAAQPALRRVILRAPQLLDTPESSAVAVTVVGAQAFGSVDSVLYAQAHRLAQAAQVDLLTVRFSSPAADAAFVGADICADVTDGDIREAMLGYFHRAAHRR